MVSNYRDMTEQGKKKRFGPKIEILVHQEGRHHRPQDVSHFCFGKFGFILILFCFVVLFVGWFFLLTLFYFRAGVLVELF